MVIQENVYLPRIHVASIETCGCVASFDPTEGKLTVYMTTQAPHAIRTVIALVAGHVGLSEEKIRVISPDIGGGFGGKVPVYPGYVIAIAASFLIGKPVKWIDDVLEIALQRMPRPMEDVSVSETEGALETKDGHRIGAH